MRAPLTPRALTLSYSAEDAAARLAVELWLDGDDVVGLAQRVAYFATPRDGGGTPRVRFVWGELRFDGEIEALEETLDFFSPDGRPLRAGLSLSLRGATLPR